MKVIIDLPHVVQKRSWDCGISAVAMVLRSEDRDNLFNNLESISLEEGFRTSTWTIDLAYLLKRFNVHCLYCTKTIGVHPEYNEISFYKNSARLSQDEIRVNEKFSKAETNGINVIERSVKLEEILKNLEKHQAAIVLVNSWLLNCKNCLSAIVPGVGALKKVLSKANSYQGHYIVVCGFDSESKEIYYRNPSRRNKLCNTDYSNFNEARHSFGTDDDVIFIINEI